MFGYVRCFSVNLVRCDLVVLLWRCRLVSLFLVWLLLFSIVWRASVFCLCGGFPGFRFLVCVATSCFGLGLWGLVNW